MTIDSLMDGLRRCYNEDIEDECADCPYKDTSVDAEGCITELHKDAIKALKNLVHNDMCVGDSYWRRIAEIYRRQNEKGKRKYGISLEENTSLTKVQRIEHLEEELIDGLQYCEHLKELAEDGITANDYQRAALRTAGDDPSKYLLNGVMGLCGEAGEVIDLVKKGLYQGHEIDPNKIAEELGDCLWYAAVIAEAIGIPLGSIMQMNIAKLKERYPEGFSKERSINREA